MPLSFPFRSWAARCPGYLLLLSLLLGLLLPPGSARAQGSEPSTYGTQKKLIVSVLKLKEARVAADRFIRRYATEVEKQEETPEQFNAEFALPTRLLPALDSLVAGLGYVLENNRNSQNTDQAVLNLRAEETRQQTQLIRTQVALRGPLPDSARRLMLRNEADEVTSQLRRTRQQIARYTDHETRAFVVLRIFDEITFPTANRKINFVNMPGVEAAVLRIENPRAGLASQYYRGYALKYLFTRGKSYFNLGFYQPSTPNTVDSTFINELFVINFGQDFYPRNFGRGHRKFLNLYTTYQIGGFILNRNGDKGNDFIPNANVGLGIELIKTKHILLDTKGSYFLPLHYLNRNLRGVLGQASFSFVF